MKSPTLLLLFLVSPLHAGPYPGAAGTTGTDAISKDDSRIVAWAAGHSAITYGADVDTTWQTPQKAVGPASLDVYDIVCLGNGGRITLYFPHPLRDGPGADFAVFENAISNTFLELAFVEVSSDGVNFHRFPSASLTASIVGAFGMVDPTNLSGLAGKHRQGFGTPFDLASLPAAPTLDRTRVCFLRIIDIIGDGTARDSANRPIYDPTPTIGSGGFDLDAVAVLHQNDGPFAILSQVRTGSVHSLTWQSNPGHVYQVEAGSRLDDFVPVAILPASPATATTTWTSPPTSSPRQFWRIRRISP
ncbi:MAG: hypothetical protein MUF31_06580 [Akkermansiaceae bacterium]|nr:hypothetical protein [Akkermansiaceae bacterium]